MLASLAESWSGGMVRVGVTVLVRVMETVRVSAGVNIKFKAIFKGTVKVGVRVRS